MSFFDDIFVSRNRVQYNTSEQFSVTRLLADIKRNGLASTSTYEVLIHPPAFTKNISQSETPVMNSSSFAKNTLRLKVESVDFPGRNIKTTDYTIGNQPTQTIGYGFTYAPINMTVIVNENLDEKVFFEQWQEIVSNVSTSASQTTFDKFTSNYFDDYVSKQIEINQFNKEGKKTYQCIIVNAYPAFISPVTVSWRDDNEYMKLQVTMVYQHWKRLGHNPLNSGSSGNIADQVFSNDSF